MKKLVVAGMLSLGLNSIACAGLDEALAAFNSKDYASAAKEFTPLAEQGNAIAQHNMARLYANGLGVPKDIDKALYWYDKSTAQGYAPAEFGLGLMYSSGDGVPKDPVKAAYWWQKAADQGNAKAQHALGVIYTSGNGVAKDATQAVAWYRKAIESGSAPSVYNLGVIYANGAPGVAKNLTMAYIVFSLAAPADPNSPGYRGIVAAQLTREQLTQADTIVKAWKPGTPLPQL
jgi:TPR repeat protein